MAACLFRLTILVCNSETFCTNEASECHLNYDKITQCIVTCTTAIC